MPITYEDRMPLPIENKGERHVPCVLLLDKSGSMEGAPIQELNDGLRAFGEALAGDSMALGRAEICVIAFGSTVEQLIPFRPASQYEPPTLSANGSTCMNQAIIAGLEALEARKAEYRVNDVNYYRPWIFLLTDGYPTDNEHLDEAKRTLQSAIEGKKLNYIPMGIGSAADKGMLQSYYPVSFQEKPVLSATAANFKDAFVWLSNSISQIANSNPDLGTMKLEAPPSCITVQI